MYTVTVLVAAAIGIQLFAMVRRGGKVERFLLILRHSTDSQQILADQRLRIMTMFSSVTRV